MACNKVSEDIDTIKYEPEFAIPLITDASVSFIDLWQNDSPGQSLAVQPDGTLVFRYESDPIEVTTTDILGALEFPVVSGLPDTLSILPFTLPANIQIEQATIAGGFVIFQFQRIVTEPVNITFTLPHIKKNGLPVSITTTGTSGSTLSFPLVGHSFEPDSNALEIRYKATNINGNPVALSNVGIIARPVLQFVKGTWGREEFQLIPDKIAIDLYDERFLNGNLSFSKPTITAKLESSFGLPIRSRVDIMNAFTKTKGVMPIDASAIDGVDINYPLLSERGQSKETTLQVDYTNSNIVEVFDAQLTELEYGLTAIANPDNDQDLVVFIEDTSTFKAQVKVEVPVIGRAKNFEAIESFEVPFDDIPTISEGEFKLIVENELPVGAQLQFYFMGGATFIIDSLFQEIPQLVEAAATDRTGQVTSPAETTTFIPISAEKMNNILQADRIQARAIFQTDNDGDRNVIIKADQQLRFRMGLRFKT